MKPVTVMMVKNEEVVNTKPVHYNQDILYLMNKEGNVIGVHFKDHKLIKHGQLKEEDDE